MIRIGPAGWSYDDWNGIVYPAGGRKADPLEYLSRYFDTIEVNSSFYRTPPQQHSKSWVRRVDSNPDFRFTTKLYKGFTHDAAFPVREEVAAFLRYLEPLAAEGRLGAVLAQYPWSFRNTESSLRRIADTAEALAPHPLVVEVRHGGFDDARFLAMLTRLGVGFANIDQPVIGDSLAPTAVATSNVAYLRFHGRNYAKWFHHDEAWERYDYLYTPEELEPFVATTKKLASNGDVYVVTNNHFRGQAIVNAIDMKRAIGQKTEVPPPLADYYGARVRERGER
ncbi:MAG: DUF72 domain-containing protein [Acidobacteria bacterium]|nr:DUF72 domain-containing protein [Acidobacteriota bacterium]